MRTELNRCYHCHRTNFAGNVRCSWCNRKLPTRRWIMVQRIIDLCIIGISIAAIGALIAMTGVMR